MYIDLRNDFLTSDKRKINDVLINLTKGDISIEKGVIKNNNTSTKDNFGTSKKTRNGSFYLKNRNTNPIIRKDVSATTNNTNIVYNAKHDRKITMKTVDMVTGDKSYNNQTLKSNLDLHSKENDDNVTRKSTDKIITKDKGAVFTNSEYERMILPKDEKK